MKAKFLPLLLLAILLQVSMFSFANEMTSARRIGFVHFADAPSLAALACEAAGEQKQFWTFHDTIFNYSGVADSAFIYNLAKSKRLNMTEFDAYLHSSDKYKEMDKVINQLVERGLMATPTIIINDRLVYVTNSYEELSRLLEYEL